MYKHLIIYSILLTTFIEGSTVPAPKVSDNAEKKTLLPEMSITKQTVSEEGSIISNPITLTNKNQTVLLNSENDLIMSKVKPVHARKGVDYNSTEDISQHDKVDESSGAVKNISVNNTAVILPHPNKGTQNHTISKPLVLSHEALEITDKHNNVSINEIGPNIKVKANSHPGMIMPIVITILVVPMFAVLGYMALKRGREAWKNRHYKRMDFLLDGMYND